MDKRAGRVEVLGKEETLYFRTPPLDMDRADKAIRAGRTVYWSFDKDDWDYGDVEFAERHPFSQHVGDCSAIEKAKCTTSEDCEADWHYWRCPMETDNLERRRQA
jgi:hypothetical protein